TVMWWNRRPADGRGGAQSWFNIEIVSPWRSAGVARFIAAAEVAGGEFFNPVISEDLARRLRALAPAPHLQGDRSRDPQRDRPDHVLPTDPPSRSRPADAPHPDTR